MGSSYLPCTNAFFVAALPVGGTFPLFGGAEEGSGVLMVDVEVICFCNVCGVDCVMLYDFIDMQAQVS